MGVTAARVRTLALALPDASEKPHFDRVAFRTPRRIFATLGPGGNDLNLMFDLELQAQFCKIAPRAFEALDNGWGRKGATVCHLPKVDDALLIEALTAAHERAL